MKMTSLIPVFILEIYFIFLKIAKHKFLISNIHINDMGVNSCMLKAVQRISILGVSQIVSTFPIISTTIVFLKASFVKKTLYNCFNGELKLHTTEQTPSDFNIAMSVGSVNILLEVSAS